MQRDYVHMYRPARLGRNRISGMGRSGLAVLTVLFSVLAACSDSTGNGNEPEPVPGRPQVVAVIVNPEATTIVAGRSATLVATARDANGGPIAGRTAQWRSSNDDVATVNAAGLVTAIAAGQATISATIDGKADSAAITVVSTTPDHVPVDRVAIFPAALALEWNGVGQLSATTYDVAGSPLGGRTVTWVSSDPLVAEVDQTGKVTAKRAGTTTVSAISESRSANAEVVVRAAPVASVVLSASQLTMETSESAALTVRLEDALGRELTDRSVTWASSDAGRVFVSDEGRVYALREGSATVTATSEGKSASVAVSVHPIPSFDLVYDRRSASGGAEVFVLSLAGATAPVKINAGSVSRDPSASADGSRIAFAVTQPHQNRPGMQNDLYIVDRNGMNLVWLTRMDDQESEPAWSPDGDRIAFSRMNVLTGETDIWVVNVDGTGLRNLTEGLGAGTNERTPAWSPDGRRIVFAVAGLVPQRGLWLVNADGSGLARIPMESGLDLYPTWSPDGARIAFQRNETGVTGTDILVVPATGGATTRLAHAGEQYQPSWSPDGAYIAFMSYDGSGVQQIYTMRPDGSGVRLRTTNAAWGGGRNPGWITR